MGRQAMANNSSDNVQRAATIMAFAVFGPVVLIIAIGSALNALGPYLPAIGIVLVLAGIGYGIYRFQHSPLTIRRQHEQEILELVQRAEAQQAALPRAIAENDLKAELAKAGAVHRAIPLQVLCKAAQAIYAEEFLQSLAPMPGVPIEGERVYDVDYDRRTLKKGEEPPHRIRTDGKGRPTDLELEHFEARLHRFVVSTTNPQVTYSFLIEQFAAVAATLFRSLPEEISSSGAGFTVPLIDFLPNGKATLDEAVGIFFGKEVRQWHHFSSLRDAFEAAQRKVSSEQLRVRDQDAGRVMTPREFVGTPREALDAYLGGTPLRALFLAEIPFGLPLQKRFEGHWIVARQGSGKTNALECLIHRDLEEVVAGRASLLVMDSQGTAEDTLIGRLASLKYFDKGGPLEGKLIYLEPDLQYPLALNIFDIRMDDMGRLSEVQREEIVSSACEVVEFLFTGLLNGELSDNMTMLYRYLVPAMLAIPDADMSTFIELLDGGEGGRDRSVPAGFEKHRHHFKQLEPEIRSFLETDFLRDPELVKTKAAVRRRLRAALADTMFRRMFMQPRNKLNLFRELQSAKVILVNTFPAKGYVEPFGRLILALLMQATRQRLEIDRADRMPTFVYLDECQDYIAREDRIAKYIDKCRKQNVGLVFSHQRLSNIESPRVLNALSGLSIKFSGVSDADSGELATMVGSTAAHIRSLPRGRFAAYVSGVTPQAVDLSFPLSPLEKAPRKSKVEFEALRQEMRSRYGTNYRSQEQPHDSDEQHSQRQSRGEPTDAEFDDAETVIRLPPPDAASGPTSGPDATDDDYDPLR
jgi:hypothetical protein